jgi:SAM-dependent methyltransferase
MLLSKLLRFALTLSRAYATEIIGINMKLKENWRHWSTEQSKDFLRAGPEGKTHRSRAKTLSLLDGMSSVLDVGCGTGVMFELIRDLGLNVDYLGVDVTEKFLEVARSLYPEDRDRFRRMSLYETRKLRRKFDAVICRHVLEHLPDYIPAIQSLYSCAAQKLILVFYLPPRPLHSKRKLDEHYQRGFYTHTYDLGTFLDHVLNELSPLPREVRIHPRQGRSDSRYPWGDRYNVIYEVIRRSANKAS